MTPSSSATQTYTLTNDNGEGPLNWSVSCVKPAFVTSCTASPSSGSLRIGFSTTITVTYTVGTTAGSGTINVNIPGAGTNLGATISVTLPVYSVSVTPKGGTPITASPGGAYTQNFTVQNTGNTTQTIGLATSCSASITCTLGTTSVSLAAGASTTVPVDYTAGAAGTSGTVGLHASVTAYPVAEDTGYVSVVVPAPAPATPVVTPKAGTVTRLPHTPYTSTFWVRNGGGTAGTFGLSATCPDGWGCAPSRDSVTLAGGDSASVTVSYTTGATLANGVVALRAATASVADTGRITVSVPVSVAVTPDGGQVDRSPGAASFAFTLATTLPPPTTFALAYTCPGPAATACSGPSSVTASASQPASIPVSFTVGTVGTNSGVTVTATQEGESANADAGTIQVVAVTNVSCNGAYTTILPCAGVDTLPANTAHTVTFTVANSSNAAQNYIIVCQPSGTVSSCTLGKPSLTVPAFGDSTVSVVAQTAAASGPGSVQLLAYGDAGDNVGGAVYVTVAGTRAVAVAPKNGTDSTTMWSTDYHDFTVHNTGTVAAIYNITASCTGVTSPCGPTPIADTLAPGRYDTVRVTYTAAADGTPTRLALIATDAADSTVRDSGWVNATVHTPCADGTATVTCTASASALINRSGLTVHFGIRNDVNEEQSFNATITCTGAVVSCSLNPNLIVHAMGYQRVQPGQTASVTVYYATDTLPGTGVIYLVTGGENGTIGGKTTVTVNLPPKTPAPQLFAVTPHFATLQLDPGQATTQRIQLQSRGTDTATYVVAVACTAHGALAGGCTPALDTVLLQPEVAATFTVPLTAGLTPEGSDTLTLRAWQANDTLVRDSSTIALTVVRDPAVVDIASVNPGDVRDPSLCLHVAVAPGVSYACGDVRLAYALPSTRTRNQVRTPVLLYDSRLAYPYIVVAANVSPPNDGRVLQAVIARLLDSTGAKLDSPRWAGSNWTAGSTRRIALLFDPVATRNYPEGAHRYALEVTRSYADGTTARDTATGTFLVVRRDHSQFGHGWWLAGLEHLHATPGKTTLFWTGGDGSARVYTRDGTSAVWHAPNVDRPDSIAQVGDRYVRYLPHGARVQFDTTHGCHLETITRLGDTTRFHYADPAGCGQLDTLTLPPASAGRKYVFTYANPSPGVWWLARVDAPPVNGQARAVTFARNSAGQLTTLVDPAGDTVHLALRASYDDRITRWIDERGDTTVITYATTTPGPVAQIAVPIAPDTAAVTTFTPAATRGLQGSPAVALDAAYTKVDGPRTDVGDSTLLWLDRFGAPWRIRNALGDETLITRDSTWPALAAQVRSPDGALAGARYDDHGNVLADSSTVALDPVVYATTRYTWDRQWDFVATITRPEGDVVRMTYDPTTGNRLTQEDGDPASRVRFDYYASGPAAGLLERIHYPLGATDSVAYDTTLGNLAATVSAMGDTVLYVRDGIGRDSLVLQRSDSTAGFRVTQYFKDILDRDILTIDSAGGASATRPPALRSGGQPRHPHAVEHTRSESDRDRDPGVRLRPGESQDPRDAADPARCDVRVRRDGPADHVDVRPGGQPHRRRAAPDDEHVRRAESPHPR